LYYISLIKEIQSDSWIINDTIANLTNDKLLLC